MPSPMASAGVGAGDARSPRGHAAFSIRHTDDRWVNIQRNTFTNWVNEQLRPVQMSVNNLQTDLADGIRLCALVEALQGRRVGRVVRQTVNPHQHLENVTLALRAVTRDNVKLVNIGTEDIVNGNLKLILALIWHLVLRYQIGKSKVPPKKLMLAWLNAVIPDLSISNFNTNWNDGVALHALIEYCRPGTCPNWKKLKRNEGLQNCRNAMRLAKQNFDIPLVLSPEDLSSPDLDELSGMTYLSYFMKVDSPGYNATLKWVQNQIPDQNIKNMQSDWNDGTALVALVQSHGYHMDSNWTDDLGNWQALTQKAMAAAKSLGVEPVISVKEMIDPEVDHLGVMAYTALFQHVAEGRQPLPPPPSFAPPPPVPTMPPPRLPPAQTAQLIAPTRQSQVNGKVAFSVEVFDEEFDESTFRVEAVGLSTHPPVRMSWQGRKGQGQFTPTEPGHYKIFVYNEGELIRGSPVEVDVGIDPMSIKLLTTLTRCPVRQATPIRINAQDARSGNVHVESRSPSGRTQDMSVVENHGVFTANFTPTEVGDWLISIMYDKTHIQGSPFNVRVYDAEQVRVYGLEDGAIGKTFSFNVETAGAGEGELTVDIMHNGRSVPVQIQPDGRSRYRVAFTPSGGGVYTIRVHFAGMEVRGSPYTVEIVDSTRVSASGDGLTMAEVNQRASFIINTDGGKSITDLRVTITSPRGSYIPSNVVSNGDGTFRVEYTVNEVGEYSIEVLYHGKAIVGSPFRAQASDWSRITVTNLRSLSSVGKLVEFDIDATKAGSGNLEIMVNDGTIPCSVQNRGNKHFHASFMPKEAMPHTVQMRFNGRDVPNSPWVVEIRGITNVTVSGPGLQLIPVNRVTYFEVDTGTGGGYDGEVSVSILTTNGRNVPCRINNNNNGIYRVEYTPTEVGNQMTDVLFDGKAVPGSPFVSKVYESSAITISPITAATVGRPVDFTIDVTRAGEGQLEIMINQGSVPNTVKMLRKGVFQVTFTPREPRTHEVDVKFNGESLPGCPMNVAIMDTSRVTVQGDGLRQVAVNRQSYFRVNTQSAGDADLAVRVTSPQGRNVPARITGDSDNGFDVEYTPTETGMHRVDVEYASQLVPGSPFTVSCFDNNAIQVIGVQDGIVGRASSFIVDANNAGEGNMEISIVAGGQNLQNHVRQVGQGRFEVSYTPVASGPHHGTVTFNGLLVPGSPFVFSAADASRVSAQGDGLSLVPTNKPAVFNINAPGARTRDLDVTVIGVHSEIVPCSLRETTIPDNFIAEWMPKDIGDYRIEIKYTGLPIPGSPFTARAWSEQRVLVSNIHPGSISKPLAFNIDASQAGAGNLEISVCVGDTNVPNFVKSEGNARFTVSFTPQITDTHMINVKFNANMVPGSPFVCNVDAGERLHALGQMVPRLALGKLALLSLDWCVPRTHQQPAVVKVIGPFDDVSVARVVETTGTGELVAEFIPEEIGLHHISVSNGIIQVPGSPFECDVYDIGKIQVTGQPRGTVGKAYKFEIDKTSAGFGEVGVTVRAGESTVACRVTSEGPTTDTHAGCFTPKYPVRHFILVTFQHEPVPGSPFVVDIVDGVMVDVRGPCLQAAPVSKMSKFEIDCSNSSFTADVSVSILDPQNNPVAYAMTGSQSAGWAVEWRPTQIGTHVIDVKYGRTPVAGSPFICKVHDLSKVIILQREGATGLDVDGIPGEDVVFYVDASGAGAGSLAVVVRCVASRMRVPNFLEASDRSGRFCIYFTPWPQHHRYEVNVTFNGQQVNGSPFFCTIVDGTRATTSGSGLQSVPANRIAQFQVQTNGAGEAELKVNITSPTGRPVMSTVNGSSQAGYTVEYTPMEVGRYYVAVQYAETDISGSPFSPEAYNASLIQVSSLQDGIVGQPVTFQVDTSMAGAGNLTVDVVGQTTNAYPEIAPRGGGKYDVVFVPTEMGPHNITITFNGEHVTGSPFTTSVFDLGALCVSWESVRLVSVGKMAVIELDTKGAPKGDIIARVLGPQGQTLPLQVTEQAGCFQIAFLPDVVGAHTIDLQYASRVLPGSPFTAFAFDSGAVRIVDVTQTAVLRQQVGFTVDTEDAGQGDVDVEVACGGQLLRTQREKLGPSSHRYSFVPIMAADHTIDITFNYEKVPGCPLMLKVVDPSERISLVRGSSMQKAMVDQNAWVMIDTQRLQLDTDDTQVSVTAPNGELVPAKIVRQPDDDYKVEYSSKYTGRHTVEILYAGLAIMGSPFYVEIYDPNKLYIEGARSGIVGQKVEFDIIRHEAGKAELSLNITCPSGRPVQYDITPTPQGDHVSYTPLEAGPHQIFITYGGLEVPGCPMTQNISSATISSAYGDGLLKGQEHKAATFYVDTKGQSGDLFVQVDGPNSIAKYKVEQDNQGRHVVSYVPVEVGHYTILVKWNGKEIEGSPFHPKIVDPGKVYVLGGWESILDGQNRMALTVNQMRRIEFDTSLAGEGQLTAEVSGPNGAHPFTMEGYGNRFTLSITPQMEGEYHVSLWWCDLLLPRSPLNGVATSAYSSLPPQPPPVIVEPSYNSGVNHERVVLTGRGLTEASVQETTQFVIDGTDAGPGIPEVRMTGVKTDIDVRTVLIGDNKYRCMYVPQVPGAYLLNIMWSDRQVRGSPFKVNVSARGDASKVTCNGDGLVMGIMGREIRSTIDARRAGPGELTAHCMGPTKVAMCELYDQNDGTFTLNVKPQEPGAHVLQVKYGGEHVPGSPFHIKVSGAPDASKVKVKGPGIEHGILATYRSHFICETRGAGAGQLTVRVRGPKGAFRVEMQRESQKDRTILCRYDPTEVGVYVLHIKWSGQQIPGSPFQVHIFDTKQELDRLMSETRRRPAPGNASTTEASMTWGDDM